MLLHLAEALRARGHSVAPVGPARGCGWLAGEFRARGFDPATFLLRFPFDPWCLNRLVRTLRARGVGAVHSHEFTMAVYGAAAARILRVPHVITMHGGLAFADRWRRRAALRWAARNSRAVAAVSGASAEAMERRLSLAPGTLQVVPNGVRPEAPSGRDLRGELGLSPGTPLVVAVGNLYPVKGHGILLRALARSGTSAHLAIAGRGDEEHALRSLSRELGIEARVHLLGYRPDIADLLAAADVFAMPSLSEGLPVALLEAMFAGKAIVASRVGGIPEAVDHGVEAVLVPPGEEQPLTDALHSLLGDAGLRERLGRAAASRARATFSIDATAEAYLRLLGVGR
jgi:glycosyltransferase involved in cell wall biosynthesis